jgi:hypothetical protein
MCRDRVQYTHHIHLNSFLVDCQDEQFLYSYVTTFRLFYLIFEPITQKCTFRVPSGQIRSRPERGITGFSGMVFNYVFDLEILKGLQSFNLRSPH